MITIEKGLLGILLISCLALGFFIYLKPSLTIDIQKKFYEKINWRIEPISLAKEIRNTRLMGLFLIVFTASFYFVFCR